MTYRTLNMCALRNCGYVHNHVFCFFMYATIQNYSRKGTRFPPYVECTTHPAKRMIPIRVMQPYIHLYYNNTVITARNIHN